MNHQDTYRFSQVALAAVLALMLGACGDGPGLAASVDPGGNGGSGGGGGTSQSIVRAGQVYTQRGESNALVCADVQGTGGCAANAATAIRTGADGSFQISFQAADDAAAQRFLAAPLLAEIAHDGFTYTLSAPAAKAQQINPLTTLVQRHIQRTGAALTDAEQAVAQQLGIESGQIYQYQQQTAMNADNARTASALTQLGLALGAPIEIHAAGDTPDTTPRLSSVNFKDSNNYDFYLYSTAGSANAAGQLLWDSSYGGLIEGGPRRLDQARLVYETRDKTGYSGRAEYLRTRGNPARVQIPLDNQFTRANPAVIEGLTADAALFEMVLEETDISGRPMADFVREMQAYEAASVLPIEHSLFTLDTEALGAAVFPAGARLYRTLKTRAAPTPQPAATSGSSSESSSIMRNGHDLPDPAAMLGGFQQPLRLQQSINGTAWEAMQKALAPSELPAEEHPAD